MYSRNKLPLILQSEMAECGLVCLAMVLGYYGYNISLAQIRSYIQSTLKGVTLYQLKQLAEHYGLIANVLRIEPNQFSTLILPCVMHWDMNHFIVVYKVTPSGIRVHDPAQGKRFIPFGEVHKYFTGIVLELIASNDFQLLSVTTHNEYSKRILTDLLKKHASSIGGLILISGFIQSSYIFGITFIQKSIDGSGKHFQSHLIFWMLLAFLGTKFMENAATGLRALMVHAAGTLINFEFGWSVMKHILLLPVSFFENRHIGDILSRFGAIEKIRHTVTEGMIEGLVDGLIAIIVLGMMFYINITMSVVVIMVSLLYFLSRYYYHYSARQYQEEALHTRSIELSHFMETLRSIPSIKIFAKEKQRLDSWANKFIKSLNAMTRVAWHKLIYDSIKNLLFGIEFSITLCIGCLLLSGGKISLGMLYAYLAYRQQFTNAISRLADKMQEYKVLALNLDRLDDITAESIELESSKEVDNNLPDLSLDRLVLKDVNFSYSIHDKVILKNINMDISKDECVAITGPSGCGKTTLFKIMMGLLPPTSGLVYCGNHTIYPNRVSCYRKKIAAVLQDDVLFSGTIIENISFFDKNVDIDRVYHCAELAGIIDEINAFPMRFYTLIGDMGSVLSGGQKQRLIIARALYAQPQILFLDEATSHLDILKEREVNRAIKSLGIMVIMIAHRMETIMMADRVISLGHYEGCRSSDLIGQSI
ncbi:MAG: peptidase domain-containing ABC transporter [Gammaproteobacteria bacterium]